MQTLRALLGVRAKGPGPPGASRFEASTEATLIERFAGIRTITHH